MQVYLFNQTSPPPQAAAERKVEFMAGIFGDPLYLGDWPASVKQRVPTLPAITTDQARRPPSCLKPQ